MAKKSGRNKAREQARAKARQAARDQAKRQRSRGSGTVTIPEGIGIYKPPEDATTVISVLPFVVGKDRALLSDVDPGSLYYKVAYKTHRGVGPEDKVVVCLKTFGKTCPICEEFNAARQSDQEYEEYKGLKSTDRDLILVANKGKLELMEIPWFWFGKPLGIEIEEDEGEGLFFFPEDEIDLKVTWETDSYGTKTSRIRFVTRKDDLDEDLIEQASDINLAECVVETDYDRMYAMFHGTEPEKEEEEEDDSETETEEETELTIPSKKEIKRMDGEELLETASDHGIKFPKSLKQNLKEEDENAIEDGRESLLNFFYSVAEDDEEEEAPKEKKKEKKTKSKCPEGYDFGADNDAYDECDDCAVFTECEKAK